MPNLSTQPNTSAGKPNGRRPRTPRGEAQQRALVQSAYTLIAEEGFEGLRTRDVAARAGVNIATLHYYFASKEDLIRAVVEQVWEEFATFHAPSSGQPTTPLEGLSRELVDLEYHLHERPETFHDDSRFRRRAAGVYHWSVCLQPSDLKEEAPAMRIDILLFDGFDELDAIAPYEVLRAAAAAGADFTTRLLTLRPASEVTASNGLRVRPDAALSQLGDDERPQVLVTPGGGWNARKPQGARAEAERGEVPTTLGRLHEAGTTLAGVCTGGMLIATAGLLAGRPAITHHGALSDLRAVGANIVDARVVDDGDIITAGGVTSGLDLALWLVERFAGARIAHHVESQLEYERRGVVWREEGAPSHRRGES